MAVRICIIGNSGSGKSTLAKAVAAELNVPAFHLDRLLLRGNFEKIPLEERRLLHEQLIGQEEWVMDGNYEKLLEPRIERATLVVFLDVSRFRTFPRVIGRAWKGGQSADTVPDGASQQKLSMSFLKWAGTYSRRERSRAVHELCARHRVPLLMLPHLPLQEQVHSIVHHFKS